ncbi:MAG: alpha/beta hydrolase [Deltaproteobacteria bacterium]|nr:MAG: alpha/beta hydrolase [Deltaproteobacteria bacterium]
MTLSVHEVGEGPAVVLCHGFPELAYSWRHQLPALAQAGFRAIAPDQRGYGGSSRPDAIEAYGLDALTGDLVGLLDALEIETAIFAGHDWGGFVVWAMPILHPERTAGVIGVNTPYVAFPSTDMLRGAVPDDEKMYILWFQTPGRAERVLDANPRSVFEKLMRGGVPPHAPDARSTTASPRDMNPFRHLETVEARGPEILSAADLEHYTRVFEETGFGGGIHWYRNIDRNRERFPQVGSAPVDVPCLMVTAEWDPVLRPEMAAGMERLVADLETVMIEKCGHWTQQDKPAELNRILVDWLGRRFR